EAALNEPQRVTQLPARPNGNSLVADFTGLYFNGADARDLAYSAAIGRDTCRGLDGSEKAPAPLKIGGRGGPWRATTPTSSSSAAASRLRWSPRSCPSCVPRGRSSSSKPASGFLTSTSDSSIASAILITARTSGRATSSPIRAGAASSRDRWPSAD